MINPSNLKEEEKILFNRTIEQYSRGIYLEQGKFSQFLNPREQLIAKSAIGKESGIYFGGYAEAERKMLGVFASNPEENTRLFPIVGVELLHQKETQLDHRAILGTLMSLGLSRGGIGDILPQSGSALIICSPFTQQVLLDDLSRIGSIGVSAVPKTLEGVKTEQKYINISGTVSSLRLDNIVSLLTNTSRGKGEELFRTEKVLQNYFLPTRSSVEVSEADVITVRGFGKFIVDEVGGVTKKGRVFVSCRKYQ